MTNLPRPTCAHCGAEIIPRDAQTCSGCGRPFPHKMSSPTTPPPTKIKPKGSEESIGLFDRIRRWIPPAKTTPISDPPEQAQSNRTESVDRRHFFFTLRGKRMRINLTVDSRLYRSLQRSNPPFNGDYRKYYRRIAFDSTQKRTLAALAQTIGAIAERPDDSARIAVSLVQNIPYDSVPRSESGKHRVRFPYEVLYENRGKCGDKSVLLGNLLANLGYGTALLKFKADQHMAVGILSTPPYVFPGTSYAFIEATVPSLITDSSGDYETTGPLLSQPIVIPISRGRPLLSIDEDYQDLLMWRRILSSGHPRPYELENARFVLKQKYRM